MIQTINFYEKLAPVSLVSARLLYMVLAWVGVLVIYLGWSLVLWSQQQMLTAEKKAVRASNTSIESQLKRESEQGESKVEKELAGNISNFQSMKQSQQMLIVQLQATNANGLEGFSMVMSGLAKQHQPGVSVLRVEVGKGGKQFVMTGELSRPEMLPAYIVRLGLEPAFQDMAFETIEINQQDKRLEFSVQSVPKI